MAQSSTSHAFLVSAPGKVLLHGEHSVVHGKAAMAAAISLRSYLHVQPLSSANQAEATLDFVDISLKHTWRIASLPWETFKSSQASGQGFPAPATLVPALVKAIEPHVKEVSPSLPDHDRRIHQAAASTFLYLFLLLSDASTPSLSFTLRSTIPIGAGLGSSASISVCLAAALIYLPHSNLPLPRENMSDTTHTPAYLDGTSKQTLDRINAFAFLGESLIHGNPSGVDNTVSTLGKAVIFRRSAPQPSTLPAAGPPAKPTITSLQTFPELPLLIVDTKQAKSTAAEVAKVGALKTRHPVVTGHILDAMDAITAEAAEVVTKMSAAPLIEDDESIGVSNAEFEDRTKLLEKFGDLITMNHGLLYTLGVSHPRLEELRDAVQRSGAGWFKLTGSGGGGCGFVLVREGPESEAKLHALEKDLDSRGFEEYETVLGGEGVGVLIPASAESGIKGESQGEISLEKFLAAEGRQGLEALCGPTRPWRYWSIE